MSKHHRTGFSGVACWTCLDCNQLIGVACDTISNMVKTPSAVFKHQHTTHHVIARFQDCVMRCRPNCWCVLGLHFSWAHGRHADMVLLKELVLEGGTV